MNKEVLDGLSLAAWLDREDALVAWLAISAFAAVPVAIGLIGLWRFLRGAPILVVDEAPTHRLPFERSSGGGVLLIVAIGTLTWLVTRGGLSLLALFSVFQHGFEQRAVLLLLLMLLGWVALLLWLPNLRRERLYWGWNETRERASFWALFLLELTLSGAFLFTK